MEEHVWDFDERLERSQDPAIEARLDRYYERRFGAIKILRPKRDCRFQRSGKDLLLYLGSGLTTTVEEKIRFKAYRDILLEIISNDQTGTPGWATKPFQAAWLCYYRTQEPQFVWLYPGPAVREVIKKYIDRWKVEYGMKPGRNKDYSGWNVPVPESVFCAAVDAAHGTVACLHCGTLIPWSEGRFDEKTGREFCVNCGGK